MINDMEFHWFRLAGNVAQRHNYSETDGQRAKARLVLP